MTIAMKCVNVALIALVTGSLLTVGGCCSASSQSSAKQTPEPIKSGGAASATSPASQSVQVQEPTGKPNLTSNLQVEAGQTFIYAGDATDGRYTAVVTNVGPVPVTLGKRLQAGAGTSDKGLMVLAPGGKTIVSADRGEGCLFQNLSSQQARLLVRIWGDTNVGMRYEALKAMEAEANK